MPNSSLKPFGCLLLLGSVALLAACATNPEPAAPIVVPPANSGHSPSASAPQALVASIPAVRPVSASPVAAQILMPVVSSTPAQTQVPRPNTRPLLDKLLPAKIRDRNAWGDDIYTAFNALQIPPVAENYCAAMAVIEQLSSWQSDPVVPNLGEAVWKEIDKRASKYHVPLFTVKAALSIPSPDGRSYRARIDALQTEGQMNELFETMVSEAPDVAHKFGISNPIRTGGPMQVSIEFASAHIKVWHYPYPIHGNIRNEVFTRRGGVYFGIAHLLQYPAPYQEMIYRFADYNAGRYSSRNAAFQQALGKLTRSRVDSDGDLLAYQNGYPQNGVSNTDKALRGISAKLGMSSQEIASDLAKEKISEFAQTRLYQRVFALADQTAGRPVPREVLPQIRLQSSKITHKLTTAWFAERVNEHYQQCLLRNR